MGKTCPALGPLLRGNYESKPEILGGGDKGEEERGVMRDGTGDRLFHSQEHLKPSKGVPPWEVRTAKTTKRGKGGQEQQRSIRPPAPFPTLALRLGIPDHWAKHNEAHRKAGVGWWCRLLLLSKTHG